jgi:hypothetical protein
VPIGTATTAPYSINYNTAQLPNGMAAFYAIAYDKSGEPWNASANTTRSGYVRLTVSNTDSSPPTVTVTAPASGATVGSPVTVSANASDNIGVSKVEFWKDGDSAPYSTI